MFFLSQITILPPPHHLASMAKSHPSLRTRLLYVNELPPVPRDKSRLKSHRIQSYLQFTVGMLPDPNLKWVRKFVFGIRGKAALIQSCLWKRYESKLLQKTLRTIGRERIAPNKWNLLRYGPIKNLYNKVMRHS